MRESEDNNPANAPTTQPRRVESSQAVWTTVGEQEPGGVDSAVKTPSTQLAPSGVTSANLVPLPVIETALAETVSSKTLCVISLNLGGRNTNPAEFVLKGDNSELAIEATAILRKAKKALRSSQEGPIQLPPTEVALVDEILAEIYNGVESQGRARVRSLLRCETWQQVLSSVQQTSPHFFNALNLSTLELERPSAWENPSSCRAMSTTYDYLNAWQVWYCGLSRGGKFWLEDAPRLAQQKGMDVATAFAGLFIFDLMSMCTARCATNVGGNEDDIAEEGREVDFKALARFAATLPLTNLGARHAVAANFVAGAHVLLAQEADKFAEHVSMIEEFMPPFCASDGCTSVFLRKSSFQHATDISADVSQRMQKLIDVNAPVDSQKAWRTMTNRLAAVYCHAHSSLGGQRACFLSLHCPKSTFTGDFIESLRNVLADFDADLHAVGMNANCTGQDAGAFRQKLWKSGFELGCQPKQQQVTVAKERTSLQTQVRKREEIDISHKDFIVSWASARVRRGPTSYTPDLRTPYGVEQETKQRIRLPTTRWPFDHCGVATTFSPGFRCKEEMQCSLSTCSSGLLGIVLLCALLLPLASPHRSGIYGEPGTWYFALKSDVRRWGICEVAANKKCRRNWIKNGGSCYRTTRRKMPYARGDAFCKRFNSTLVTIGSEAENQFLIESECPAGEFCYIGLQGLSGEEHRWWASGEETSYTRIVSEDSPPLPLFPISTKKDTIAAILNNLPNEQTGFDINHITPFGRAGSAETKMIHHGLLQFATAVSGLLFMLPRPKEQRFATLVLRMAFWTNAVISFLKVYQTSFADDFAWYMFSIKLGKFMDATGRSLMSVLAMSMVVKRMSTLYPAKAIRSMFGTLVGLVVLSLVNYFLFVDNTAELTISPPVIFQVVTISFIVLLFLVLGVKTSTDLYRTWAFLHKEATTGLSSQGGTSLASTVRTAKLHFITVLLSTTTSFLDWGAYLLLLILATFDIKLWSGIHTIHFVVQSLDSVTNDLCVHLLAVMNMDGAVMRAKGITAEVAERATQEVEQHRLAVRMLKAAPTSPQQKRQISALEGKARNAIDTDEEKPSFLILQSAINVETARIHRLMQCVRMRAMTMPLRYQYLIDIPVIEGAPRQQVPEKFVGEESEAAAAEYFDWLYAEAAGAEEVFFNQMKQLLAKFSSTPWSTDLGLAEEEFPWTIWAGGPKKAKMARPRKDEGISPGDIMIHCAAAGCQLRSGTTSLCFVWEETSSDTVRIHRCGMESPEEVPRDQLRCCNGGAVFVPGPQKKKQRCWDKVKADYEGEVAWPAAASLVDISRCMILLDDPYAIAVLVAYICKTMKVLRLKNRFSEDVLETPNPEELQSMFSAASSASGTDHDGSETQTTTATYYSGAYQYRDIALNVEVANPNGVPIICEIQVSLSNLAVLKSADQKLYTVRRMKSPMELSKSFVFTNPC